MQLCGALLSCFMFSMAVLAANRPGGDQELLANLRWREIGPTAFGGRITDVEVVSEDPRIIYVGAASGGIFKSVNNGTTWKPVFDDVGALMGIGDLAIAPSDPSVLFAGTGEANNRQSSSWGEGVFRSLDAGESWESVGLPETHHIGRILIHPTDPRVVYVAALGRLWGPGSARGVYRSRDGGESWKKVLFIDADTGVVDLAMEENGRVLYACAYQRRRRAWGFVGGGPGSGIYRSVDGGDHWTRLSRGLPSGTTGRIGISIARSRPETVYAIIEHAEGGVFRSDDRGLSWNRVNSLNPRPMYYSQIRVDPTNVNTLWVLGSPLYRSIDGGASFTSEGTAENIHVDHHALWIDPADASHMILGNDGGLWQTYDGADNWDFINNLPIAQYYSIEVDNRDPYWIYGGTQDNGTWALPSRTNSRLGIMNRDVLNLAYGDGFDTRPDPAASGHVYAESQDGRLYRISLDTLEEQGIRPLSESPAEEYRFNWHAPIHLSPHDRRIVYYGANKLLQSRDQGLTWREISPDLTRNQDWKQIPVMGTPRGPGVLSADDGIEHYGTITAISESVLRPGLILVGTDDGQIQMTRDGGETWTNQTARTGLEEPRWVSDVLFSVHDERVAYVTLDGHRDNDFSPYLLGTTDGGETWSSLSSGLPTGTVINTLAEDPDQDQVLLAGSESGLFISLDGGRHWQLAGGGLPRVPVDEVRVHPRDQDIVVGTHGRGIWILDHAAFLGLLQEARDNSPFLFPVRKAVQAYQRRLLPRPGAGAFRGENPPGGALITYYLGDFSKAKAGQGQAARIVIRDDSGRLVREVEGTATPGLHRVSWDLRHPLSFDPHLLDSGWFGHPRGILALPGTYEAELRFGSNSASRRFEVSVDPRAEAHPGGLKKRFELSRQADHLLGVFEKGADLAGRLAEEIGHLDSAEKQEAGLQSAETLAALRRSVTDLRTFFGANGQTERAALADLFGQLQASTRRPTDAQTRHLSRVKKELREHIEKLNQIVTRSWPQLRRELRERELDRLAPVQWRSDR